MELAEEFERRSQGKDRRRWRGGGIEAGRGRRDEDRGKEERRTTGREGGKGGERNEGLTGKTLREGDGSRRKTSFRKYLRSSNQRCQSDTKRGVRPGESRRLLLPSRWSLRPARSTS